MRMFAVAALCLAAPAAWAQDAGEGLEERLVVAPLARGSEIRGLVSQRPGSHPDHVALLFVGGDGVLRLREEDGAFKFNMKGNFLAWARRHLNSDRLMTVLVDCPTDHWSGCDAVYRQSQQYADDVSALMTALSKDLGPVSFTVIGTSVGSMASANLARTLGPALAGAVHTSTLAGTHLYTWQAGMTGFDWSVAKIPQLFVHHRSDPCRATPYEALRTGIGDLPLITVLGANNLDGPACGAFSQHGYRGRERATMQAIATWIVSGEVVPTITNP